MIDLSPHGFVTEAEALSGIRRDGGDPVEKEVPAIQRAFGRAISWMENRTGRRLACRTYRDAVTLTGTAANDALALTLASGTVYAGDDVVGAGMQPGTIVDAVSGLSVTLSKKTTAQIASGSLTFGSERLQWSGHGPGDEVYFPETPVKAIYSLGWLDGAGQETAIDTTGARLDRATGLYFLPNGGIPQDPLAIIGAFRAGYERPTATSRGDSADWYALQGLQIRIAQIFFDDERRNPGRPTGRSLGALGANMPSFKMPDDVKESIAPYVRRG